MRDLADRARPKVGAGAAALSAAAALTVPTAPPVSEMGKEVVPYAPLPRDAALALGHVY